MGTTGFSLGAGCLLYKTYVDDIFAGAQERKLTMKNELCTLLHSARIELNTWAANQCALMPRRSQISHVSVSNVHFSERIGRSLSADPVLLSGWRLTGPPS